jgi:hypothetical protein
MLYIECAMIASGVWRFLLRWSGSKCSHFVLILTLLSLGLLFVGCSSGERLFPGVHIPSPNKKLVASFYALGGGGAAGYLDEFVEIHRPGEQRKAWKEVLQLSGAEQVCIVWPSDHELSITYPEDGLVVSSLGALEMEGGIKVSVRRGQGARGILLDRDCGGCLATLDNVTWSWRTCTEGRVVSDK